MPSTYSTNLALELMATGEKTGLWGTVTNSNLGTLLEQAISGYVTQAITDGADTTITIPNGATGVARNMVIEMTGALTNTRNLVVPANKKLYFIYNNTTGGHPVVVKVSGQTGVSVANGKKLALVSNGTDVVELINSVIGTSFPSGTRLVFQQTAAPTGWTKESGAAYNDAALRFTTGTASTGGADAFNTLFGAAKSTASFTLTSAEIPAHLHAVSITSGNNSVTHTHSTPAHTHTVTDPGHTHTLDENANTGSGTGFPTGGGFLVNGVAGHSTDSAVTGISIPSSGAGTSGTNSATHTHAVSGNTGNTGSGGAHSHTLNTMNLKFADCVIAVKN